MTEYNELQKTYWQTFSEVDNLASKYHLEFREKIIVVEVINSFLDFINIHEDQIDEKELELAKAKIDFYIGTILLDSAANDILSIIYFNQEKNLNYTHLASLFNTLKIQFKFYKNNLPLQSTYWKYFTRDMPYFVKSINREFARKDNLEKGNLYFFLLSAIDALNNALNSGDQHFRESMYLYLEGLKGTLNLEIEKDEFWEFTKVSPGFVIYLIYLSKKISELIPKTHLKKLNVEFESLNLVQINPKSLAFYMLNNIELKNSITEIEEVYNNYGSNIKNGYSYLDFFIQKHISFFKEDEKYIGVDVDFNKISEQEFSKILSKLLDDAKLKDSKDDLEEIGKIVDWASRLEKLYEWYDKIPVGIKTTAYGIILKVLFG